ncbi:hypothetical protein [Chromobacterium subtsugae]|uniref:hypothetical protein n=1 Tax=Chromobacterium subtsugae TaxID=251747 RepID=UPI00128E3C6C|nr:hypothetical protein [Chromobacterium subtsugae]
MDVALRQSCRLRRYEGWRLRVRGVKGKGHVAEVAIGNILLKPFLNAVAKMSMSFNLFNYLNFNEF